MARKPKRRGAGEGTCYKTEKKLANGKTRTYWAAELYLGLDANGKKQVVRFSGKSQEEVLAKMAAAKSDQTRGILTEPPTKETVRQFLERWLQDSAKHSVRARTYESYASNVKRHIIPELGRITLKKLTPAQVQRFYALKLESGLSPRSVQYLHAILHRALKQAVKWGLVPRNVTDAVDRPRVSKKAMQTFTPEQADKFLDAAKEDRLYALYVLALSSGMRQGELLGLSWDNVDLETGRVQVRQQLQDGRDGIFNLVDETKGQRARNIKIPAVTVDALRKHRKQQAAERLALGKAWHNEWNLVFTSEIGTPIRHENLLRRSYFPIFEKANAKIQKEAKKAGKDPELLPRIRFHDLRHTAATLLLIAGIHPKVVQEMLGHAQISLTLDTYSHVLPSMQDEAADKMNEILTARKNQQA